MHTLSWLTDAKRLLEAADYESAIEILLVNLDSGDDIAPAVKWEGLKLLGTGYRELEEFDSAERVLKESLDSAKANDASAQEIVNILEILGEVYANDEKYTEAEAKLKEAVTLFHDEEIDIINRISCLYMLGEVSSSLENDQEAKVYLEAAVRLARMVGDPEILSDCLRSLGDIYHLLDQFTEAEQALVEAVDQSAQEGVPKERLCRSLMILSDLFHNYGLFGKSHMFLEQAVQAAQDDTVSDEAKCYIFAQFGQSLWIHGRVDEALPYLTQAANIANNSDEIIDQTRCTCLHELGQGLHSLQRYNDAENVLAVALEIANSKNLGVATKCDCLCSYADVLYSQWDDAGEAAKLTQAESALHEAVDLLCGEGGLEQSLCNALISLGEVLRNLNRFSEAEEKLREALRIAESCAVPAQTKCNGWRSLGIVLANTDRIEEAIDGLEKSIDYLFQQLATHRGLKGVANIAETYQNLFIQGRRLCEQAWKKTQCNDNTLLWNLLAFWDSEKCISIRERLRRQLSVPQNIGQVRTINKWQSRSSNWSRLFKQENCEDTAPLRIIRSLSDSVNSRVDPLLEIPKQNDTFRDNFCNSINSDDVTPLLPTTQSVLIGCYFAGDDLVILPIRQGPDSKAPLILHSGENLFRLHNVRGRLNELLDLQQQMILALKRYKLAGKNPHSIDKEIGSWQKSISEPLYSLFQWDKILDLITFEHEDPGQLHLTFIPNDFLYQIPIHTAFDPSSGHRLFELVGSINYGLSLRTLELQTQIQKADRKQHRKIEGTVFAFSNPDQQFDNTVLPHAFREVYGLVEEIGVDHLWIHGDQGTDISTRDHLMGRHALGNLLWHVTHGGEGVDEFEVQGQGKCRVRRPSILLADGIVSDSRMVAEHYDFSDLLLNHYSCCTLGKTSSIKATQELEGWIASLTQLGCRRVSCAIWELCDAAAADFGRCWIHALKEKAFIEFPEPHAFSRAFKQAVSNFRSVDEGRWNHEFYWGPYLLYGLT